MTTDERRPIERPEDASKGSYASVLMVEGVPLPLRIIPSEKANTFGKFTDRVEIRLAQATFLKMVEGEDEPELKDGVWSTRMNYAQKGKKSAHKNSVYVRGFVQSLADAKTTWSALVDAGERVILEWKEGIPLGFHKNVVDVDGAPIMGEDGVTPMQEDATGSSFVLSTGGSAITPILDHIKKLVLGKNDKMAARELMMDSRAKQKPEFKQALDAGTLAEKLGLKLNAEGIFVE